MLIFAEGADRSLRVERHARRPRAAVLYYAPYAAGAVVGVEIDTVELREAAAAVAIAAGDRSAGGFRRTVDKNRRRKGGGSAVRGRHVKGLVAFEAPPAIVLAAVTSGRLEVDLFAAALAHIANEQVAGLTIEGETPGVTQPVGPDFVACAGVVIVGKRVVGWDIIRQAIAGVGVVDVDPQNLTHQRVQVLRVADRSMLVAGTAAVAGADVEVAVRSEL